MHTPTLFLRRLLGTVALAVACSGTTLAAAAVVDVEGAKFETSAEVAGKPLVLNGAGLRTFLVLDVYAAGLYVPQKETSADALLAQSGPKSIRLVLLRNLTAEEFTNALVKGFTANQSPESMPRLQARLDELKALMLTFGEAKKGWTVEITYLPGSGTRFFLNGQRQGRDIAGEDFYAGLMKIWIGSHPVDTSLKRALVGAKNG